MRAVGSTNSSAVGTVVVLNKSFLLAEDAKIKDETILRQISQG